jgi:CheY-like chemotaxis protein
MNPPLRILVVEDCPDTARGTQLLLTIWGYDCRVAPDGPAALAVAGSFRPEVVLLDLGLPGLGGAEVARRLRQEPETAGAFLVALTGCGHEQEVRRDFDRLLRKPSDPDDLRQLLAERVASSRSQGPGGLAPP